MATATLILPLNGAQPDPTSPPDLSIGAIFKWLFDAGADQYLYWQFNMPADYVSSPTFKFTYSMASATSGDIRRSVEVKAVTPATEDIDAATYDTALADVNTVPGTLGHTKQVSVSLSTDDDALAANDFVQIRFGRTGVSITDDATGDMELLDAKLEYSNS